VVRALAIDVGSTSVRTALVDEVGQLSHVHQARLGVSAPRPDEVELDAAEIARTALALAARTLADGGPAAAVGVATQRATTIVFDAATLAPVGPALSWQDLRTVIDCLILQGEGVRLAPNQSATKAAWLVRESGRAPASLRVATVETWLALQLSGGDLFVTDRSNAAVTGLVDPGGGPLDGALLERLGLAPSMLAAVVDTTGPLGPARALPGAPVISALVGDQSASLFGQGCVHRGAKFTLGTGAMLDAVTPVAPSLTRLASGCFPIVASSRDGVVRFGVEAIMLSAGSCLEWLVGLGLVDAVDQVDPLARAVDSSEGAAFVPALNGLGTPHWDFGARSAFFGLTRGSTRAHLARAVLEGVAQRGADLVEAARADTGLEISHLRVDGGLAQSGVVLQALADHAGCVVELSPEREATARGAGLMALVGAGHLDERAVADSWRPALVVEPRLDAAARDDARARWADVVGRARATIPELSAISF
jgi:glycerol kinase